MRHQVTIKRPPTEDLDDRGQPTGDPTTVRESWPCEIKQLSGLELIRAKKLFTDATYEVRGYDDPGAPIAATDYIEFGSRTLHIGEVVDLTDETGVEIALLCKEEK